MLWAVLNFSYFRLCKKTRQEINEVKENFYRLEGDEPKVLTHVQEIERMASNSPLVEKVTVLEYLNDYRLHDE